MGRMLGAFDNDNDVDRPDLNKCPDCGCYFKQDVCPLCGKICPEEMRAGNRASVRVKKKKRDRYAGRVTFVEWYHSWWFILIMLFVFPIVGLILLFTSPHKTRFKILLVAVVVLYTLLITWGLGSELWNLVTNKGELVDTSLSREEYIAACEDVNPVQFYRSAEGYTEEYVTMTLTVSSRVVEEDYSYSDAQNVIYYLCTYGDNGEYQILIRDCVQDTKQNFVAGDVIRIYGEGAGNLVVYDLNSESYVEAPGIYAAYIVGVEDN